MSAINEVRTAQCDVADAEGRYRKSRDAMQRAATAVANAELALNIAKARARQANRQSRPRRESLAWIESWWFLVPAFVGSLIWLWSRAQGWTS